MSVRQRRKVLLVDDNRADVSLIEESFRALHIHDALEIAFDGEQALELLSAQQSSNDLPDIILLDINMPKVDGFQVLSAVRSDAATQTIPVVMLTSSRDHREVDRAYAMGANSFLCKPMDNFFE